MTSRDNDLNRMADHDLLLQIHAEVKEIHRRLNGYVPDQCLRTQLQLKGLWATMMLVLAMVATLIGIMLR